jgi:alkanesulfonate monooxygenase SsuD/methylene tetrahydromethanopterin reductase-like flavin-dependent oxidoreductase (luciferase family)
MWNMKFIIEPVITGATGIETNFLKKNLETIPVQHSMGSLQKTALLGTPEIVREILQSALEA